MSDPTRVLALSGGIGGAKLALGLSHLLEDDALMVVCNTGDDFRHLGLSISPDVDTVLYTLAGMANRTLGWGRENETWVFMDMLERLGGESWFRLGDGDLALHVERTRRLAAGDRLSQITDDFARCLGVTSRVVPMSDDPVPTLVHTAEDTLAFQHYFVRDRAEPVVTGFDYQGAAHARPSQGFWEGIYSDRLEAIVICPSNPFISIDPILALPGVRKSLREASAPVIAVSPIIAGNAIKGPTAKMMRELGVPQSVLGVLEHYRDLVDGLVIDDADAYLADTLEEPLRICPTLMSDDQSKRALAGQVLDFARELGAQS